MGKFIALWLLLCAQPAIAAAIKVAPQQADTPAVITVQGALRPEDIDDFQFKIASVTKAVVILDSDGGSLLAGIRIGTLIRLRNFVTLVPDGGRCASACAIAWLGGTRRFMGSQSLIGFHAAYLHDGGKAVETGAGNAILGAYLNQIGLSETAILYITKAAPNAMTWLTMSEAAQHNIEVHLFAPTPPLPSISSTKPENIPRDGTPGTAELERRTKDFVLVQHAAWSAATLNVTQTLAPVYADQVLYHGKAIERSAVIGDKKRFVERWPQRKYDVRGPSLLVRCATPPTCTVAGVVDWATSNPVTMARARGSAEFKYSINWSAEGPQITLETGSLIHREKVSKQAPKSGTGWWVVLASFTVGFTNSAAPQIVSSVRQVSGAAYLCGFSTVNDFSAKFSGFSPGYMVVAVGPFADKAEAARSDRQVNGCVSGTYLKHAQYLGE